MEKHLFWKLNAKYSYVILTSTITWSVLPIELISSWPSLVIPPTKAEIKGVSGAWGISRSRSLHLANPTKSRAQDSWITVAIWGGNPALTSNKEAILPALYLGVKHFFDSGFLWGRGGAIFVPQTLGANWYPTVHSKTIYTFLKKAMHNFAV